MKTGIFITARLSSTRLKRKHLAAARGEPIVHYLIKRITTHFGKEIASGSVVPVIATADEPENREFEQFSGLGVNVVYGSPDNIPVRHLQAADALNIGRIIAVDGDDILCSVDGMRLMLEALNAGAEYARTTGLPFGMNSMGYTREFLERSLSGMRSQPLETGWTRVFDQTKLKDAHVDSNAKAAPFRFTLDYEEDLEFFRALIEELGERVYTASDEDILTTAKEKGFCMINAGVEKKYWENFNANVDRESSEAGPNRLYQSKAHLYIPAGAHTYSRADDSFPENAPPVLERGKDGYVWDMEGRRFLDFGMALRAVTIGYDYGRISDAAIEQIRKGNNLTRPSKIEVEAAETLCSLMPWVEMVKFAKNGSNVTSAAVKLARAYTGKKYVAKCAEHPFFSFDDWFIGRTVMDRGVPEEYKSLTLDFHYNDMASVERLFSEHPGAIAAVILEPAATEEPKDGFLHKLKELCKRHNTVFILDEMITGFRWHIEGASKYYDIVPDLVTYGKGMANGFSVAALGGRRDIMELGGIRHAGERVFLISTTHGAEMSGLGAFVETMKVYKELDVTGAMWSAGKRLMDGMNGIAKELGISDYFSFAGMPCSPNFITKDSSGAISLEMRTLFVQEMIENNVLMPWVALCYMHGETEIDTAIEAGRKSLKVYARALEHGARKFLKGRPIKPVFRKRN